MSNRKVLDKIGLANCPVTVGALADRDAEIAKKDANGMISTEDFVRLYSETVEVIEQDLVFQYSQLKLMQLYSTHCVTCRIMPSKIRILTTA